jgi:protein-L-isoaspartate(D-aspartate) O-methyltransferase
MAHNEAAALADRLRPAVGDERVLSAIAMTPRERFVRATERDRAYENVALPIDCKQTISQPLVVARMLEALELHRSDRVLDVGTGSGYHAALLAQLVAHVWTIERHPQLSATARDAIDSLGIDNVTFVVGDGGDGLPDQAPFDAINVAAAADDDVPESLERQLAEGGRLVVPVGGTDQYLMLARRTPVGVVRFRLEAVRFVPLVRGDG